MLKTKSGFILRKLGNEYMVVAVGAASDEFNGMIQTNETGAFLWEEISKGIEKADLVNKMVETYEGLDVETASKDLDEYLASIDFALVK